MSAVTRMTSTQEPKTRPHDSTGGASIANDPDMRWHDTLRDGTRVLVRPIQPKDASLERAFVDGLTPQTMAFRFLGQIRVDDEMIEKLVDVDLSRDMAFVALRHDDGETRALGVSRFYVSRDGQSCECVVTVAEEWQGRGLGYLLMRHLIDVARQRGIKRMYSIDVAKNQKMRELANRLGFERNVDPAYPREAVHTLSL